MSLKDCIKAKANTQSSSSKKPSFYNKMKNSFIEEMVNHDDDNVRLSAVSSINCPSTVLSKRLNVETEPMILKTILMNSNLPQKAILEFTTDSRATQFDSDDELFAYIEGLNIEA